MVCQKIRELLKHLVSKYRSSGFRFSEVIPNRDLIKNYEPDSKSARAQHLRLPGRSASNCDGISPLTARAKCLGLTGCSTSDCQGAAPRTVRAQHIGLPRRSGSDCHSSTVCSAAPRTATVVPWTAMTQQLGLPGCSAFDCQSQRLGLRRHSASDCKGTVPHGQCNDLPLFIH